MAIWDDPTVEINIDLLYELLVECIPEDYIIFNGDLDVDDLGESQKKIPQT